MPSVRKTKRKKQKAPARKAKANRHLEGIRLRPAMKDALDEIAFEWQTTRAVVVRELIAHALKSPPKRTR